MSSNKDHTQPVLASLKAVLVHVTNIQGAISEGGEGAPAQSDLQALKVFIHSAHWHHQKGADARLFDEIRKSYHKMSNPPQVGLDTDIQCMAIIADNIQTLIDHLSKSHKAA